MKATLDLTDAEARALVQLLRRTLDFDRFPHAPRLDPLKAILEKFDRPGASARTSAARWGLGANARGAGGGGDDNFRLFTQSE